MIDLVALITKDGEVAEAVDKIISARVEFSAKDITVMPDDQYAIIEPFYDNAVKETLMDHISSAKEEGREKTYIPFKEIVDTAISKTVETFNEDDEAVASFWTVLLGHFLEEANTEKDVRDKILQIANLTEDNHDTD